MYRTDLHAVRPGWAVANGFDSECRFRPHDRHIPPRSRLDAEPRETTDVSADWVRRAQQPNTSSNELRYGYQFWLNGPAPDLRWPQLPADAYAMQGNRAQTVMVIPSAHAVLVRLGWSSGAYPMAENFATLLRVKRR